MTEPKVYADLTFLINFTIDFLILWATARFSSITIKYRRLIFASLVGGIYGMGFLYIGLASFYTLPAKIGCSILLIILAFWPLSGREFKKTLLIFYVISLAVAGATIAISYMRVNSGGDASWSYLYLLGGIVCALVIGFYGEKYLNQSIIPSLLKYQVKLSFNELICVGEGFLDTGNGLRDPITHRPIVVAEYAFLKTCLPEDFKLAMENNPDENDRLEAVSMSSWANRMRLIPFSSIGKKNGLLIGVRCDEMIVKLGKKEILHKNMVVGIYPHKLSAEDSYQLLIPSEVIQNG